MDGVNYASNTTPPAYQCSGCGATGVKLWREYMVFGPCLFCVHCASAFEGRGEALVSIINDVGEHTEPWCGSTRDIGPLVAAIPDEEGVGYWGDGAVPDAALRWWRKLPTRS